MGSDTQEEGAEEAARMARSREFASNWFAGCVVCPKCGGDDVRISGEDWDDTLIVTYRCTGEGCDQRFRVEYTESAVLVEDPDRDHYTPQDWVELQEIRPHPAIAERDEARQDAHNNMDQLLAAITERDALAAVLLDLVVMSEGYVLSDGKRTLDRGQFAAGVREARALLPKSAAK
jgi:hypothetical protein